jgi:hypothetical protein
MRLLFQSNQYMFLMSFLFLPKLFALRIALFLRPARTNLILNSNF